MPSKFALEALMQRGKSELYLGLIKVYEEALDSLKTENTTDLKNTIQVLKNMKFNTKIKSVCNKHMGPLIVRVRILTTKTPTMLCEMSMRDDVVKRKRQTHAMILSDIASVYDDKKGSFKGSPSKDITFSIHVSAGLFMVRNKDKSPFFTAEELAAATVHELGHVDNFIRYYARSGQVVEDACDIVDYVRNTKDIDIIKAIISHLKNSPHTDRSWKTILKDVDNYFSTSNSLDSEAYTEALNALVAVMAHDLSGRIDFNSAKIYQDSNRILTNNHFVSNERSSDEFASRNGAYEALSRMVMKLEELDSYKSYLLGDLFFSSGLSYIFFITSMFSRTFKLGLEDVSDGYDPLTKRIELIIETAKHAFHQDDLPPDIVEDIKRQIYESEKYLKEYHSLNHVKIRKSLYQWKQNILKFGRLIAFPFGSDRLQSDYTNLQNATRTISRNPLYYLAKS